MGRSCLPCEGVCDSGQSSRNAEHFLSSSMNKSTPCLASGKRLKEFKQLKGALFHRIPLFFIEQDWDGARKFNRH